jgi:hypothetical protein
MAAGALAAVLAAAAPARAGDDEDRLIGGVLGALLGAPPQSQDQIYSARERDRLVQMLQGGEYATSRQGETVDAMVYGIPLTHRDHVYTAKPTPPAQVPYRQDSTSR